MKERVPYKDYLPKMYADACRDIEAPFEGVLDADQIKRALDWYKAHKEHVDRLRIQSERAFPPTLLEDKIEPRNWKSGHWRWFINRMRDA